MKKVIISLILGAISFVTKAQETPKELFSTATITTLDTSKHDWVEKIRVVSLVYVGAPSDSTITIGNTRCLYFGNYKVTLYDHTDYLHYLDKAVEWAIRDRQEKLYRINNPQTTYQIDRRYQSQQRDGFTPTRNVNW